MNNTGKNILIGIKEYSIITLGIVLYVLAWTIFLVPNNLIGGGVSGLASIVQYATNGAVKIGTTYFAVNAILLVVALRTLGRNFGVKSVYAIIIASVGLNWFQSLIPQNIIQQLALDNGKLMSTIMGGIMVGIGIGLSMSQGGSTGGTDIVALVVNKYRNVSPGRMIMFMDVAIVLSSLLVPSYTKSGELLPFTGKITNVVYAGILIAIASTVLDLYLTGTKRSVQLFIFSKRYAQIADAITRDLNRGVTVLNGKGWYSQEDTEVLVVVMKKTDLNMVLKYIKNIDPDVFLSVSFVTGVYGKGFDTIKTDNKKLKLKDASK